MLVGQERSVRASVPLPLRLENVLRRIDDAVIIVDKRHRILNINKAASKILKIQSLSPRKSVIENVHEDELKTILTKLLQYSDKKTCINLKLKIEGYSLQFFGYPLLLENEERVGTLIVIKKKPIDSKFRELRENFVANVSHELKTPLTILKGQTEVALRKERDNEDYKSILKSNLEEINRMAEIIDDLMLLSKADTKEIKLSTEDVSLKNLISDVCMNVKIFADNKGIGLIIKELEDVKIKGDELKLRRMFLNVVENGIKYTQPGGKVEISSSINNGYAQIDIRDNGVGIAEDDIKFVFDRFYRGDKSRKRESGSGLGLSISKWIAEIHKGTIEVQSRLSEGSLFSIKLPV